MDRTVVVDQLHSYASLFTSSACEETIRYGKPYDVAEVFCRFDASKYDGHLLSVWKYLSIVYKELCRNYRNEYVYKNELLSQLLIKQYGLETTIAINEFGVGRSIVDLALFNDKSRAFEIKSDRDSAKRLGGQLADYGKLFDECWVVVPEDKLEEYKQIIGDEIGIITLSRCCNGCLQLKQKRAATENEKIDIDVMMSSVRCSEFRQMTLEAFGHLPDVRGPEMYAACKEQLGMLLVQQLKQMFLSAVKSRKTATPQLGNAPRCAKQLLLGLNTSIPKAQRLDNIYSQPIIV